MKKIKIYPVIVSLIVLFGGCSVFDLEMQKKYDYDYSVAYDNQLNMSGWEFLQENRSTFSRFLEAVRYAEIDPELFNQPNTTIFPLRNTAITSLPSTSSSANQNPGGYWAHNPINGVVPDSWEYYSQDEVKQFVLNHIVRYAVSYYEFLAMVPGGARTFFPTMATNGYGYVSFHMLNSSESDGEVELTRLYINDFESHYKRLNPSGWAGYFYPHSSNLQTSNGSYVHVMDFYLDFPTDKDLATVPVYNK